MIREACVESLQEALLAQERGADRIGLHSVLTSGGAPTAQEGLKILEQMIAVTADDLEIIVAGKVTPQNIHELHGQLGSKAYHGRKIVGDLSCA